MFLDLNARTKGFKDAGNSYFEENYLLVNKQYGCGKRDISIASVFIPLANRQVPSNTRKLVGIVETSGKEI